MTRYDPTCCYCCSFADEIAVVAGYWSAIVPFGWLHCPMCRHLCCVDAATYYFASDFALIYCHDSYRHSIDGCSRAKHDHIDPKVEVPCIGAEFGVFDVELPFAD